MSARFSTLLFKENWSEFQPGFLNRDNSAKGEYMAMVSEPNVHGWHHTSQILGGMKHSPFRVHSLHGEKILEQTVKMRAIPQKTQCAVLTTGEKPWRNFFVKTKIAVLSERPIGVVVRYRNLREFYALSFESGRVKILRVFEGIWHLLDSAPFPRRKKEIVPVELRVDGDRITASAGAVKLSARDGCIPSGGIGLLANGPSRFGEVTVKTTSSERLRMEKEKRRQERRIATTGKKFPGMELVAEIDVRGHVLGRQIRFADLDGDGREELVFAVPGRTWGRFKDKGWRYNYICRLSALNLDGKVLWERGKIQPESSVICGELPFQAADRGNGVEVVAVFRDDLEVLDPLTGKRRAKSKTPRPVEMKLPWGVLEPWVTWETTGFQTDLNHLIPDALRLCNVTGRGAYHDILVKDNHHHGYVLDGKTFKLLWIGECNIGHFPYSADIDGDGRDEFVLGFSQYDHTGHRSYALDLGDHPDGSFMYTDAFGHKHVMHAAGDMGYVDLFYRQDVFDLGHVQHLSVANWLPDSPDLERIIVTYHGNEGIIMMLDHQNRILWRREEYAAGSVCQPVNWTGDGKELIAFSPQHGNGGLVNANFDLAVAFPNDDRPGKYMEIRDVLGLGIDQVVVWDEERLHVYAPDKLPKKRRKRYAPIRPVTNLSNYQVNYSIPAWK